MRRRIRSSLVIAVLAMAACAREPEPATGAAADAGVESAQATDAAAAPASDAAQQTQWQALLARLDRDGDGVVSRSEHALAASVTFSRMDRDGDATVSVEEMAAERESLLDEAPTDTAKRLAQVDANGDGALDGAEHEAATGVVFEKYDRDGDARLVETEFEAVVAELRAAQ